MNFLAHAYLSYGVPEILTGNLMADTVKGKPSDELPEKIRQGIYLHRSIDSFTDMHPENRKALQLFRPTAGRLAPVFLDIAYDYFLANHIPIFPEESELKKFAANTYDSVDKHVHATPEKFRVLFQRMKKHDWLSGYRHEENMARSFHGVSMRTALIQDTSPVFLAFLSEKNRLHVHFRRFFPELEDHVKNMLFSSS
jgi:acyl carrier protein phosphodiesterase